MRASNASAGAGAAPRTSSASTPPRAWRSLPSNATAVCSPRPSRRPDRVAGRPARAHTHVGASGHRRSSGAGRHTTAPRSIRIWFHAQPSPAGTSSSAPPGPASASAGRPPVRARTRAMLVSTTATSRSNANASTARAVYGRRRAAPAASRDRRAAARRGARRPAVPRRGGSAPAGIAETLPQPQHVTERSPGARAAGVG